MKTHKLKIEWEFEIVCAGGKRAAKRHLWDAIITPWKVSGRRNNTSFYPSNPNVSIYIQTAKITNKTPQ